MLYKKGFMHFVRICDGFPSLRRFVEKAIFAFSTRNLTLKLSLQRSQVHEDRIFKQKKKISNQVQNILIFVMANFIELKISKEYKSTS